MTLTLEKVISPDLCEGSEWVVADEDALAEHVARIALGQYRHVAKILLGEGATAAGVPWNSGRGRSLREGILRPGRTRNIGANFFRGNFLRK